MTDIEMLSPAEQASQKALEEVLSHIKQKKSFVFEAGAGAGKTYSLVETLKYLIQTDGQTLLYNGQRIACITYTNVAKNQILDRTNRHPAILSETIHSFSWSLLKKFQSNLRTALPEIGKWDERLSEVGGIGNREIVYDLGYPRVEDEKVWLHHNDVLTLMVKIMEFPKFRKIMTGLYPILFIDEYQDTDKNFAESLKRHFVESDHGPVIGFFGDHWQKIYGSGSCGLIESEKLGKIEKRANFRSEKVIVNCLNRMRPELPQEIKDPNSEGTIEVFHTNAWQGERLTGGHWGGDMPSEAANTTFEAVKTSLEGNGWSFNPKKTKILMLTHNVLADKQGYQNLIKVFKNNDDLIKKEDDYISFFADVLEPAAIAFENKKYGEMFLALDLRTPKIKCHQEKVSWAEDMEKLCSLRKEGTIGDVIKHLLSQKRPRLPDKIEKRESKYSHLSQQQPDDIEELDQKLFDKLTKLKAVPYSEMIALAKFIGEETPFSTKHGVKGEEYENVLVVLGRGWNQYNFGNLLDWASAGIPNGKQDTYDRNRNLFYVACSRPISRMALLFTQELTGNAIQTLSNWFGEDSIKDAPLT